MRATPAVCFQQLAFLIAPVPMRATPAGDTFYIARYLVSGDDQASLYVEVQDVQGPDVICVAKNDATLDGLLTVRV